MAGISLNFLVQNYPDRRLRQLIESGAHVQCLFLDPAGTAMTTRERDEGYAPGPLAALTELNIQIITARVREHLPEHVRDRLQVAVYDETPRFNITLTDRQRCVVQPYLPQSRGLDSPTLMLRNHGPASGLFPMFEQVFTDLWSRSRAL